MHIAPVLLSHQDLRDSNCVVRKMGWGVRLLGRGAARFTQPVHLQASLWMSCGGCLMGSVVAALLRHGWVVPARLVHLHARRGWQRAGQQQLHCCTSWFDGWLGCFLTVSSCLDEASNPPRSLVHMPCRRSAVCLRARGQRLRRRAAA